MTIYAFDIDGTIDSLPYDFQQLMGAIVAKGDSCWIITGVAAPVLLRMTMSLTSSSTLHRWALASRCTPI